MKKAISLILVLLMIVGGSVAAFAAAANDTEDSIPADVKGTPYEAAVRMLMDKEVISGYSNGTFRPDNAMDRAEACAVIVKAMNPVGADLYNAKNNIFDDMQGYEWAQKYVNYAVDKGVVSGTGNDRFSPADKVTYNEMAAMLVNAIGYKAKDLKGSWPDNYINKAKELMIFSDVTLMKNGDAPATRGDVALMTAAVADKIEVANSSTGPVTVTSTDGAIDNGKLAKENGRIFGVILDTTKSSARILMGNRIYDLSTNGRVNLPDKKDYLSGNGDLYCLKLEDGVIVDIAKDGTSLGSKDYKELTGDRFSTVTQRKGNTVTATGSGSFAVSDFTVFYIAQFDEETKAFSGYTSGNLRDVEAGSLIRAFDLTKDGDNAGVAIVVKAADADKIRK